MVCVSLGVGRPRTSSGERTQRTTIPSIRPIRQADMNTDYLSASDYAVLVTGLPKDATQTEVLEHFDAEYSPVKVV